MVFGILRGGLITSTLQFFLDIFRNILSLKMNNMNHHKSPARAFSHFLAKKKSEFYHYNVLLKKI